MAEPAFWQTKSLQEMTRPEWESLCDGCGKCCLHKLEDEDTEELVFTSVACRLLDRDTCRCSRYDERQKLVPDCWKLSPDDLDSLRWLPATCAYRLLYEGEALPQWHPLVSGRAESVHEAQQSVRQRCINEQDVPESDWCLYVIDNLE